MAFDQLENNLHWVLDVTFGEDLSRVNLDSLPWLTLRPREAIGWSSGAPACQEPPEAQSRIGARSKIWIERVHRRDTGQSVEPAKLVAPMLARFMTTDRAFLRARREKQTTR